MSFDVIIRGGHTRLRQAPSHLCKENNLALSGIFSCFLILFLTPLRAGAQADAPPHNYLDLGPHYIVSPGLAASSEYRNILLSSKLSARLAATATYRGFSLAGAVDRSIADSNVIASEVGAIYSHKLPYFDFHVGLLHSKVESEITGSCSTLMLSGSTNAFSSAKGDFAFETNPREGCHSLSFGISRTIWQKVNHQIDIRGSGSEWRADEFDSLGWSVRAIGRIQLRDDQGFHYHVGYIYSKLNPEKNWTYSKGFLFGLNYVWEFR